ncbi:hypothetical protein L218DRAFT_1003947 [Marasmius fiardii PR-910]|nr:hypothetical protein L218DRAFT_1003947 [Marasmius fiardii PR-910]
MRFSTITSLIAATSFALTAVAAPSPYPSTDLVEKDLQARATCSGAYNGNTPDKRGPGVVYTCSQVSWVIFSYVCYVGTGPTYCCSGDLQQTSAGPMVGGCF